MPRVQSQEIPSEQRSHLLDLLWTSIAELNRRDEVKAFFKDLLSESEAIMLARRIKIAQRLLQGRSYEEIQKELRTSRATVATIHRWLVGGFQGYEEAITRFEKILARRNMAQRAKHAEPYSFEWLKNRYPLHFLFFNIMDEMKLRRSKQKYKKFT